MSRKITGVYAIQNLTNGKVYVGSAAVSMAKRWTQHRTDLRAGKHANRHLQSAWVKYGEAAFWFSVVETCAPGDCLAREQCWIDDLGACDRAFGYNAYPTAGSPLGCKRGPQSSEKRAAASETFRKLWATSEHRAMMSARTKEMWRSEEHRARVLAAQKVAFGKEEVKKKMSDAGKRRYASADARAEQSARMKKALASPEVREKISAGVKGVNSPERSAKLSSAVKKRWESPEARAALSVKLRQAIAADPTLVERRAAGSRGLKRSPETLAKMSAAQRKRFAKQRATR